MKEEKYGRTPFKHFGNIWRTFECLYCHTEKRLWMMRPAPVTSAEHRLVDFRQRCSQCQKITPHVETTADE